MFLDKGVKLDSVDDNGKTLLFVAQDKDLDNKILAAGVNPNVKMKDGRTALMWGTDAGAAEALIAKGADVNAVDNVGKTAMHYLAEAPGDVIPKAKVLLAHGARWDEADKSGRTPFAAAQASTSKDYAALLQAKGVKPVITHAPRGRGVGGGGGAG
jgi:ankyrin repeat protein